MTPDDLAKPNTEHAHQRAIFAFCNNAAMFGAHYAMQNLSYDQRTRGNLALRIGPPKAEPAFSLLFAIHNQGHGDAIRGGRAKAEGVKSGVPDMFLPIPRDGYSGLFIELKLPKYKGTKGGGRSETQIKWADALALQGYSVKVAYGWEQATRQICEYLAL